MNTISTVVIAILVFGLLILIHELGHFVAAKSFGVKVKEFAIGMGPVLFRWQGKETQYALRLVPMGGFVSMEGEDEESDDERSFTKVAAWKKLIIVSAGAIMNLILGLIIAFFIVASREYVGTTTIVRFEEDAVSAQSLQLGDEILKVNGSATRSDSELLYALLRDDDGTVEMQVKRDGEKLDLQVPFYTEELEDGLKAIDLDFKVLAVPRTFGNTITHAFYTTTAMVKQVYFSVLDLITGQVGLKQLSGPVGTAGVISQATSMGLLSFLNIVAFITVNLGVFNLLPLPALDGGRLLFLLLELLRGKPVNPKYEGYVHGIGLLLLLGLMAVVTYQDIVRLVTK